MTSFDPVAAIEWPAGSKRPWVWIVVICFLFVFPAIVLHGAHYEEGTLIGLARGAFEDGHWLEPHRYGVRFVERPVLLSWGLALIGLVTGSLPIWLARIPTVVSLLAGALLIYYVVRQYASAAAALFGALCFMASPLILRKVIVAEADLFVSVLLFAAAVVLLDGEKRGATFARWLAATGILTVAALVKGPQPLGFFFLGFGVFFLVRRRWADVFKLGCAGLLPAAVTIAWYAAVYRPGDTSAWAEHARLYSFPFQLWLTGVARYLAISALDFLPGWLVLIPLAARVLRKPTSEHDNRIAALILYAMVCFVVVALWPNGRGRYAMPAILGIAAAAGLAFDAVRVHWPRLTRAACFILVCLTLFRLALNWLIIPALPDQFAQSRYYGQFIAEAIATNPGPLYVVMPGPSYNSLIYVPGHTREIPLDRLPAGPLPMWVLADPEQERALRQSRPQSAIVRHLAVHWRSEWNLIEITRRE